MGMMWGWLSAAAVRASRLKRSTIPSPMSSSAGASTLIATLRSSARSWARYTVAMPPRLPVRAPDLGHLATRLGRGAADVRQQHRARRCTQAGVDRRLLQIDVEPGPTQPALFKGLGE